MRSIQVGEDVLAPDGSRLGTVERIVVDEDGDRVTHVVVKGRAIPAGKLADAGRDGLAAGVDDAELERLPDASLPPFAAPGEHWEPPEGYALESFLSFADAFNRIVGQGPYQPPVHIETGAGSLHEITDGSPVWCGSDLVGKVDRLMWDGAGHVSHVVVRHGFPHRRTKVPEELVEEVAGNNVHLKVAAERFKELPEYDPLVDEGET